MKFHCLARLGMPLLLALLGAACAGSRSYVVAPDTRFPVSFSSTVRDADGSLLGTDDLLVVGKFEHEYSTVHMLWSIVPLSSVTQDISTDVDQRVTEAGGEAIVNLNLRTFENAWMPFAMLLSAGILPVSSSVQITGDIVRRRRVLP